MMFYLKQTIRLCYKFNSLAGEKMNKLIYSILAGLLITLSPVNPSFARMGIMWQGSDGWGMNGSYCGMYNTGTIETISGEIISINKFTPIKGMSHGVHIMVKTDTEIIPVHLGPLWYIEKQDFKLETKEKIKVKGSVINFEDKKTIMASEVTKGNTTLRLWDEKGRPVWSGCCSLDR